MRKPAIAIVPARGGSKRIPAKNRKAFVGKPLIQRCVERLSRSGLFETVIVSTDDNDIANLAIEAGAEFLGPRPLSISDDFATTASVVLFELSRLKEILDLEPRAICTIYPTAILVDLKSIEDGFVLFESGKYDCVMSVVAYSAPTERAWRSLPGGYGKMIHPEFRLSRTQDFEKTFYDAGQFYWSSERYWYSYADDMQLESQRVGLLALKRWESVDIDTYEDWQFAEMLFRVRESTP
jgi:pseudaminic acid cytidylyltransferase